MVLFIQLAEDMHKFSRHDKKVKGPTITHMWYDKCLYISVLFINDLRTRFIKSMNLNWQRWSTVFKEQCDQVNL